MQLLALLQCSTGAVSMGAGVISTQTTSAGTVNAKAIDTEVSCTRDFDDTEVAAINIADSARAFVTSFPLPDSGA